MLSYALAALIFALDVYAIIKIVNASASALAKTLWVLVVFLFPVLGLIVWFFAGPKDNTAHAGI